LFVSGFATSLRVERGHLVVRSGAGSHIAEARIPKISRPRLRRLVVFGRGGWTSWEALAWLDGVGASFLHLDRSGRLIASSGQTGPDQPALRRAQVLAADSEVGLEISKRLLGAKLEGQRAVLEGHFPQASTSIETVARAEAGVKESTETRQALGWEAKAASAYWSAWAEMPVRFADADVSAIPERWTRVGERHSQLSSKPRLATTPAHAIANYLYRLAEAECRLALLALGLDPGLGWTHRDAPYRNSAALDLLEPIRPRVDEYLAQTLLDRTFSRREFLELPTGQVRLAPTVAKGLAESTLGTWEREAASFGEAVVRTLAGSAARPVRVPGRATRGAGGKGKGSAARKVLAEMRASPDDPARSAEAIAKRVATNADRRRVALTWELRNPGPHDPEVFRTDILPGLLKVTLPQMMRATGLTSSYCWRIRNGERIPHPMYWESLHLLVLGDACKTGRSPFELSLDSFS
jgi:CRISPR-associated protein Cas1